MAVAVGGALLSTFTAIGWWIAVVGFVLIVFGLVWGVHQNARRERDLSRPHLPEDPGRLPQDPPQFVGSDHLRLAHDIQTCLARPGMYLIAGPVGSGKSTVCAKVLN